MFPKKLVSNKKNIEILLFLEHADFGWIRGLGTYWDF